MKPGVTRTVVALALLVLVIYIGYYVLSASN
jgi:hypothetical protein